MLKQSRSLKVTQYSLLGTLAVFIIFPIYYMLIISMKSPADIYRNPSLLPWPSTFDNYSSVLGPRGFIENLANSLFVAGSATLISIAVSIFAAYSLVNLRYKYRDAIGRLIILAYLTPSAVLFIPLAVIMAELGRSDTLHGLIFVYLSIATPLSTWLLMGFFRGLPRELEEQARVDGANRAQAFAYITLPMLSPGLVAVGVISFTIVWNELLFALVLNVSPDKQTVPVAITRLITGDVFRWGEIMAASMLSALPVMILYYLGQRFIVQGLAAGAVKG